MPLPALHDPQVNDDALAALGRRLAAVEGQLGEILELARRNDERGARVEDVLSRVEPLVDDLRPMFQQLMAGKFGRILRTLSAPT